MPAQDFARAEQLGFEQCARAMQQLLRNAPPGWAFVLLVAWEPIGPRPLLIWLAAAAVLWLLCQLQLHRILARGAQRERDANALALAAVLDGASWGLCAWAVAGHSPVLDAWLIILMCGVGAISATAYLTHLRAYAWQLGAYWLPLAASTAWQGAPAWQLTAGSLLFYVLLFWLMRPVSARLIEGLRLQIDNERMAQQLRENLERKAHEAATDALTGLANRRSLDQLLDAWLQRPPTQEGLAVLMLDIDHFKAVNDRHGHGVGDATLKTFAERVRAQLRSSDQCARYGGEEFCVLLPGATHEKALEIAERLRAAVASQPLLSEPLVDNTVSVGLAWMAEGDDAATLLQRADAALYEAKRSGRNRVVAA
ncbi:GGDEF domain-containing protein [Inhella proteolytica]|uniref:diguanylate cyclase n=1 Tax=Inhella proteolytica TaxID=2795029 RepID=A0A931J1M5_9BURK|nr:GGDEF domain-containing protein [Inhella proteolytica]MBH9576686.1 GGDEF domain-containing protein [Inhella proteolytica]